MFNEFNNFIKEAIFFLSNLHYLEKLLILSLMLCLFQFYIIFKKEKNLNTLVTHNASEWCYLNNKLEILDTSENFFNLINIEKDNFIVDLSSRYNDLFILIMEAKKNQKSFSYLINDNGLIFIMNYNYNDIRFFLQINNDFLFDILPIPASISIGKYSKNNKLFNIFHNAGHVNIPLEGEFVIKNDIVYKKEIRKYNEHCKVHFLSQCFRYEDFIELVNKPPVKEEVLPPMPICIFQRNGDILKMNNMFRDCFALKDNFKNLNDILDFLRCKLIHDHINFKEFKNNILQNINFIKNKFTETLLTLDNRFLILDFYNYNSNILLLVNDLTAIMQNIDNNKTIEQLISNLLGSISDICVIVDKDKKFKFSNYNLITSTDSLETIKYKLKNLETTNNNYKVININNQYSAMLLKNSLKGNITKIHNHIDNSLSQIYKLIHVINSSNFSTYIKYINFLIIITDNLLKLLELSSEINLEHNEINLNELFLKVKDKVNNIFPIKNIQWNIVPEPLYLKHSYDTVELLYEFLLLICYKYQTNNKIFNLGAHNNQIYISIEGYFKEEEEHIYFLIDMFKYLHINSQIQFKQIDNESFMQIMFIF